MTTTTVSHAPLLTTASIRLPAVLPNLLRSEWAKLASVRSTYWNLVVVAAAIVVVGVGRRRPTLTPTPPASTPSRTAWAESWSHNWPSAFSECWP